MTSDRGGTTSAELTGEDRDSLAARGFAETEAERQLTLLRARPSPARLVRPCVPGDGVVTLDPARADRLEALGSKVAAAGRLSRFVPASGAASRMFSTLRRAMAEGGGESLERLAAELERFAFAEDLRGAVAAEGDDLGRLIAEGELVAVARYLLDTPGLGYATLPKGLLKFHAYPDGARTPLHEHLLEAAQCIGAADGRCSLHFTVSEAHRTMFEAAVAELTPALSERCGARFEVGFSTQSSATDTLAVDLEGRPFRRSNGRLLLRPGGHGALIRNLGALEGDLVQVKNIDNVVPDRDKPLVCRWKRILAGALAELQAEAFELLEALDDAAQTGPTVSQGVRWLRGRLGLDLPPSAAPETLRARLERPIRVCGVVPVEGEPGGGPFWVRGRDGAVTPQIVEQSQIDVDDPLQHSILAAGTHFNPVDLVCGVRDRHGAPYDLERFVDPRAVFISDKSFQGRPLRALERPGLWNGAMARWNTLFVEVPPATFAPVKTVFDLLRPAHQPD